MEAALTQTLSARQLENSRPGEFRVFAAGMISRSANAEIIRKMQHLAQEMHDTNLESETLPLEHRLGTSLMMAIRPGEIQVFQELRRVADTREFT